MQNGHPDTVRPVRVHRSVQTDNRPKTLVRQQPASTTIVFSKTDSVIADEEKERNLREERGFRPISSARESGWTAEEQESVQAPRSPEYRLSPVEHEGVTRSSSSPSPDRTHAREQLGVGGSSDRERRHSLEDRPRRDSTSSDIVRRDSDRTKYHMLIKEHCANMEFLKRENEALKQDLQRWGALQEDNNRLRAQVQQLSTSSSHSTATLTHLSEENAALKEEVQETEKLRLVNEKLNKKLADLQDDLNLLEQEKSSLMATLQLLQEELMMSEKNARAFSQVRK